MGRLAKITLSLFAFYLSMVAVVSVPSPLFNPFSWIFLIVVWPIGALLVRRETDPDRLLRYTLVVLALSFVCNVLFVSRLSEIRGISQLSGPEFFAVHYAIRLPVFLAVLYAAKRVVYDGALPVDRETLSR